MSTLIPARSAMHQAIEAAIGACEAVLPAKDSGVEDAQELSNPITPRLSEAFALACQVHRNRARKGTAVPYLIHLMGVVALVGESGGGEDEMIAAMLHYTLMEGDESGVLTGIRARFGNAVAETIQFCADHSLGEEKAPWLERKQTYLARLVEAPLPSLRVVCADKLHNAQSISRELKQSGPGAFERFKGDRDGTLWYYRSLARIFGALVQDEPSLDSGFRAMIRELRETVAGLEG
jgi:(p)ppGpp synthase/HD superfamily hydrolase